MGEEKNAEGGGAMVEYMVTAQIRLEVEAHNEAEAKQLAMEDISDFLRHNSFADLLKVQKKKTRGKL